MSPQPIDPAPRVYPPFVRLVRRSRSGRPAAPAASTVESISEWLLSDAIGEDDLMVLFEALVWRIVDAGIPLDRASLHVGTLHPEMYGFAWNWLRSDGLCDEMKVAPAVLNSDAYRRNPLYRVIAYGETVLARTDDPELVARYPLIAELAEQGITEYIAVPLRGGGAHHNAATLATARPGGFTPQDRTQLRNISQLFALHVERHIVLRIAANVLDTYLGHAAGGKVLAGSIKRGSGEPIRAVIWASDLRGFTDLSERLSGPDMIAVLNAYFGALAGAVMAHGGEVLKFIGDGMLAVFPYSAFANARLAASAAFAAARDALAAMEALNEVPPADLAAIDGWRPLRTGIALHEGEVFFGNVGAPERLDFTVIGRPVNAAARVEALTKEIGRDILVTAPVAALLDEPLDSLGEYALRGVAGRLGLFAPAEAG